MTQEKQRGPGDSRSSLGTVASSWVSLNSLAMLLPTLESFMFSSVCLEEFGGGIGTLKYRPNQSLPLLFILVSLAEALPMGSASAGSGDKSG